MREAYQYRQFWDRGFDGENAGNPADITFAILEQEGFRNTHVSFNEDDDRDDADGPTWDPANCAGIAPSQ